jgi:hypothetical protein
MEAHLDPLGSGVAADAVPPGGRSVLTAEFQLDQLEFVGTQVLQCGCNGTCTTILQPRLHSAGLDVLQRLLLVAGVDLAGVEVALLPNTLLLELPGGWYAWPPPSEPSGAASVASAAAIEAARASSLVKH